MFCILFDSNKMKSKFYNKKSVGSNIAKIIVPGSLSYL